MLASASNQGDVHKKPTMVVANGGDKAIRVAIELSVTGGGEEKFKYATDPVPQIEVSVDGRLVLHVEVPSASGLWVSSGGANKWRLLGMS